MSNFIRVFRGLLEKAGISRKTAFAGIGNPYSAVPAASKKSKPFFDSSPHEVLLDGSIIVETEIPRKESSK